MVRFEIGTKTGKTIKKDVDAGKINSLMGMKLGEEFDGGIIDMPGYKLKITGGSDKEGFPMRKGVTGTRRARLLVSGGVGYQSQFTEGLRKRKSIRGETLATDVVQINVSIAKEGKQSLKELFPDMFKEEAKEEAPKQE